MERPGTLGPVHARVAGAMLGHPRRGAVACPHCGWTRDRAVREGLFGCPLCYEALGWPLHPDRRLDSDAPRPTPAG